MVRIQENNLNHFLKKYLLNSGCFFHVHLIPSNTVRTYGEGNYEADIATSKDTTMSIVISEDEIECSGLFEISE